MHRFVLDIRCAAIACVRHVLGMHWTYNHDEDDYADTAAVDVIGGAVIAAAAVAAAHYSCPLLRPFSPINLAIVVRIHPIKACVIVAWLMPLSPIYAAILVCINLVEHIATVTATATTTATATATGAATATAATAAAAASAAAGPIAAATATATCATSRFCVGGAHFTACTKYARRVQRGTCDRSQRRARDRR